MEDDLKKMEDDLIFLWKTRMTTSKKMEDDLENGIRPKKMEDEPINQNQPNWLLKINVSDNNMNALDDNCATLGQSS